MTARMVRGLILASTAVMIFVSMGGRQAAAQRPAQTGASQSGDALLLAGWSQRRRQQCGAGCGEAGRAASSRSYSGRSQAANSATATTDDNGVANIICLSKSVSYTVTASNLPTQVHRRRGDDCCQVVASTSDTNPLIVGLSLVPKTTLNPEAWQADGRWFW